MTERLDIPEDVRSAVLSRLEDYGVKPVALGEEFLKGEGYGSFEDFIARLRTLYGDAEADRVRDRMRELVERELQGVRSPGERGRIAARSLPRYALIAGGFPSSG